MVSTAGGIVIAVLVILIVAAAGWVIFTQLRARSLGLPAPTLSSYLPWKRDESAYGAPRPAPGGIVGWVNDQIRKFKNRGSRSASGAYEQPLQGGAPRRGFGPLDPDEAWDTRVGPEADSYGYYEERAPGGHRGDSLEYSGAAGADVELAGPYGRDTSTRDDADERGRQPGNRENPFDDDAEESLRGVSPRPMDGGGRDSVDTRRSAFREQM